MANNYVKAGKETLYLQHFNVVAIGTQNTVFYYPYMTNILAPYNEAKKSYQTYKKGGFLEEDFYFVIPVYNNMPSSPKTLPTVDGNPNNKLKGLSLNDYEINIGSFSPDITSYSAIVEYGVSRVRVAAALLASTSSIEIDGKTFGPGLTDVEAFVDLQVGNNVINIKVTAENGDSREYYLVVMRQESSEKDEPKYQSSAIKLSEGYASGIQPGTLVKDILADFTCQNCSVSVESAKGTLLSETEKVGTGCTIFIHDSVGNEIGKYSVLIYGDCTGDGIIDGRDILCEQWHIIGLRKMDGCFFEAADVHKNNMLDGRDILTLQWNIIGLRMIEQ